MTLGMSACATIASAQVLLTVDQSENWIGWMEVSELPANGGAGLWGSGWATADLAATFTGINELTLLPNTNVYNAEDAYWVDPITGLGAKQMSANMYVENDALVGQSLSFDFAVDSLTLTEHSVTAFFKVFDGGYGLLDHQTMDLTSTGEYSFAYTADAEGVVHVQYGFTTTGANVNPAELASFGSAVIVQGGGLAAIPEPSALGLLLGSLALVGLISRRRRG